MCVGVCVANLCHPGRVLISASESLSVSGGSGRSARQTQPSTTAIFKQNCLMRSYFRWGGGKHVAVLEALTLSVAESPVGRPRVKIPGRWYHISIIRARGVQCFRSDQQDPKPKLECRLQGCIFSAPEARPEIAQQQRAGQACSTYSDPRPR